MAVSGMARGWRMAEKRRALGRGLGALIPSAPSTGAGRPVDVFFTEQKQAPVDAQTDAAPAGPTAEAATHAGPESSETPERASGTGEDAAPLDGSDATPSSTSADEAASGLAPVPG